MVSQIKEIAHVQGYEMPEVCHVCNQPAVHRPGGRQVNHCDDCDGIVCSEHSDQDYDMRGDPGHFVCTQWVCKSHAIERRCERLEKENARLKQHVKDLDADLENTVKELTGRCCEGGQ